MFAGMRVTGSLMLGLVCLSMSQAGAQYNPQGFGFKPIHPPHCHDPQPGERRPIDLVICLDTSGSMTALIDSARGRLWDVVNQLSKVQPMPKLRVGLLTYGSPNLSNSTSGWVVRHCDLTDDLDTIYARMMSMSTNGGEEFVGWVLNDAVTTMSWSHDPAALKLIFVAGNESADQAAHAFNFRQVADLARRKDIIIHSIYAGDRRQGINEAWDQVALYGGGGFSAIDMHCGTIQTPTPYDDVLLKLNLELNATYVPYGDAGQAGCANQVAQDENAKRMGLRSEASRAAAKSTALYSNAHWDLVDACRDKEVDLAQLPAAALPAEMQGMDFDRRKEFVETRQRARSQVQQQIQEINAKREEFLRQQQANPNGEQASLDDALLASLRESAEKKGFRF